MAKRGTYALEFRAQLIELARSGRTPEELSREFEPSAQTIRNWVRQADRDAGRRADGLRVEEKEELRELRREIKRLRQERKVLANAEALSMPSSWSTTFAKTLGFGIMKRPFSV